MKKTAFLFLFAAVACGILFAQTAAPVTAINGTLGVSAGRIAVKSGNLTYYPQGVERLVGFIDGLKDGAQVSMEGYVSEPFMEGQTERLFFPVNLTLNGKTYDMGRAESPFMGMGRGQPAGPGGGYWNDRRGGRHFDESRRGGARCW